jgi:hypothetical protein
LCNPWRGASVEAVVFPAGRRILDNNNPNKKMEEVTTVPKRKRKRIRLATEADYKKFAQVGYLLDLFRSAFHHGIGHYNSHFCNTIPCTTAFRYLYRRFGPSPFDGDTYKDLFCYGFVVGRTLFTLHGGYEAFMHLQVNVSKKEMKAYHAAWKEKGIAYGDWLANAMMDAGLPPWAEYLRGKNPPYSKATSERWGSMHRDLMVAEIGLPEYERLDALPDGDKEVKKVCTDFNNRLCAKFKDQLDKPSGFIDNSDAPPLPWDEIPRPSHSTIGEIEGYIQAHFPSTWIDLQDFIWQMKRATNIRDVSFNLAGEGYADVDHDTPNRERLALYDDIHFGIVGINHQVRDLEKALKEGKYENAQFHVEAMKARLSAVHRPDGGRKETANKFTGHVPYFERTEEPTKSA